jgi:hypothetical protein
MTSVRAPHRPVRMRLLRALVTAGVVVATAIAPATGGATSTPWYLQQCADSDGNRVDDYLESLPAGTNADIVVEFLADSYDSTSAGARIDSLTVTLGEGHRSYTSPAARIFVDDVRVTAPFAGSRLVQGILADNTVAMIRPLQSFAVRAPHLLPRAPEPRFAPPGRANERRAERAERAVSDAHEGSLRSARANRTDVDASGNARGGEARDVQIKTPGFPVRLYFLGSGVDDSLLQTSWGFSAISDDPSHPEDATNPPDGSQIRHDTFLATRADSMLRAYASALALSLAVSYHDVSVIVTREGGTTLREVVMGLDAIAARERQLAAQGTRGRAVVCLGVDASGVIANHTVIWTPNSGVAGMCDKYRTEQGTFAISPSFKPQRDRRRSAPAQAGPCVDALEAEYQILSGQGVLLAAGAGNDAADSLYPGGLVNPVGVPPFTMVASALEEDGLTRASYSNWAPPPNGASQNGHPDLGSAGAGTSPAFPHAVYAGTSIATGDLAVALALALTVDSTTTLADIESATRSGVPLPHDTEYYGRIRLNIPELLDHLGRLGHSGALPALGSPATGRIGGALLARGAPDGVEIRSIGDAPTSVLVLDATGRRVATLRLDDGPAVWDGRDSRGRTARRGVYLFADPTGARRSARAVLLR